MTTDAAGSRPGRTVTLLSAELQVVVLPDKGADIYSITDRATGIDVLFKTPWGWRDTSVGSTGDSQQQWLARYPGGWQQLIPNAGAPRRRNGVLQGYHGEAATIPWTVLEQTPNSVTMTVDLLTVPLRIQRSITVDAGHVLVSSMVSNLSSVAVEVAWVEHPAFGGPFLDAAARLYSGARSVLTDAQTPGTFAPDSLTAFPTVPAADHRELDLQAIPPSHSGVAGFAALTDFTEPWFAITSPTHGFSIGLCWSGDVLPHAWFWQECHATASYPWFQRAYAVAVEPANVLPGRGTSHGRRRGQAPLLPAGQNWAAQVRLVRVAGSTPIDKVSPAGEVHRTPQQTGRN